MKIAHLTSVHTRYDTRIFLKQCCSLHRLGHEVILVVADDHGDEVCSGILIRDVGAAKGRVRRIISVTNRIKKLAYLLDADIYHIHDPELLPTALKLKRRGKTVIFDSHEDIPQDIMTKSYLPTISRKPISYIYKQLQNWICHKLDGIIAATPSIKHSLDKSGIKSLVINNYPIVNELSSSTPWASRKPELCYIGSISRIRGIIEITQTVSLLPPHVRLNLGGELKGSDIEKQLIKTSGWLKVNVLGYLNREKIRDTLSLSMIGLVLFHPGPNHTEAQPNKLFEYMAAGIPVIASDFPLWQELLNSNNCGLTVNPLEPTSIAEAAEYLIGNPDIAEQMGQNGLRAVKERYNWSLEASKLEILYDSLLVESSANRATQ